MMNLQILLNNLLNKIISFKNQFNNYNNNNKQKIKICNNHNYNNSNFNNNPNNMIYK